MERNNSLDFKVGIFVTLGIIILAVLILFIGDFRIFKPGYRLKLIFGFANGIKNSAPVRFAGVEVGKVDGLRLFLDSQAQKVKVEVTAWVESDTKITRDSLAQINSLDILGEKYVEILPGTDYSYFLKNGDVLVGEDPVSMHELTSSGKRIALKIDEGVGMVNEVIGDEQWRSNLKNTVEDLRKLVEQIQSGSGTLGKLIYDKKIYNDLEEFVADVKAHPWKLFFRGK